MRVRANTYGRYSGSEVGERATLGRYRTLVAHRSFRPFFFAGVFSFAAPSATLVVLLFTVAEAYRGLAHAPTFAALALSFLGLSATIPTLGSAFVSGTLADRIDRRRLMRAINLAAIASTLVLAFDLVARPTTSVPFPGPAGFFLPLWVLLLYPLWAAITVTNTLFRPAFNASLPRLVAPAELGSANGLIYSVAAVAAIGAQFGSGAVGTAFAPAWGLGIGIAYYAATQVALARVDVDLAPRREGPSRRFLADAKDGFRFLWRRKEILEITVSALVINFLTAVALVELGLYVVDWLSLDASVWVGVILAGTTAGTALGLVVVNRLSFERRVGRVLIGLTAMQGATIAAFAFVHTIWFALPDAFLYGMVPGMFTTVFLSAVQATVPDAMLGRVFAADEVGSYALVPAGQFVGGLVTVVAGLGTTFLAAGAGMLAMAVGMAAFFRSLRGMRYDPVAPVAPVPLPPTTPLPPAEATGDPVSGGATPAAAR